MSTETTTVVTRCPICRNIHIVEGVDAVAYKRWQRGLILIQDALPDFPAETRELLQTGIDVACFKRLFAEEEAS